MYNRHSWGWFFFAIDDMRLLQSAVPSAHNQQNVQHMTSVSPSESRWPCDSSRTVWCLDYTFIYNETGNWYTRHINTKLLFFKTSWSELSPKGWFLYTVADVLLKNSHLMKLKFHLIPPRALSPWLLHRLFQQLKDLFIVIRELIKA